MARRSLNENNLFFFDCETGGLSPALSDMVEVACVVTDPTGSQVLHEYSAKVLPKKPVAPGAAKVNGYTAEKWAAEGVELHGAMVTMLSMARDAVFVAHNAPFDWGFFASAMAQFSQRWNGDYHKIDTAALALPLLKAGLVADVKLVTLTAYFGIEHEAHRALGDARACWQVYQKLMARYAPLFKVPEAAV